MSAAARVAEVAGAFLKLGVTSFGGPIAHLGYFRDEFVARRRWLSETAYADLVALCQFLPGPASSQVGIALGLHRAGLLGAAAAWLAFTLPSALALVAFAYGLAAYPQWSAAGWVHGLKVVAVAVVAQAVWGMGRTLCPDRARATLAVSATLLTLAWPGAATQVLAIVLGALIGWRFLPLAGHEPPLPLAFPVSRRLGAFLLILYFALLAGLPLLAAGGDGSALAVFDAFYRAGSLVFGGGHVVLPLLRAEVVPSGWVSDADFLAGYGAAQAVPGPLFTFAAYLGAVMNGPLAGWAGALLCLAAIFLPAFLLIVGVLPFWERLRRYQPVAAAFGGVNAAVVGILLAALYDPIWTTGIRTRGDFVLAAGAFVALVFWKLRPVSVVVATALGGAALALA
ncbi:MAG: chromate transporter [Betaproteobacteria bacterium RIFCSPLOWO2_02_67_12]|nr:MAG: chromate transporter [Betaproteobacteria bacterium RIFCSPLOWO2_02_67_12]OGA30790.1 MAG: chromate transporter [Betaproteobacteria bacterium RIFCSPLOWO2_02_FULL_68_150]OGA69972.1 MAG: chromate transporter [Betaproteobacteria bacterium RIFCSPLOWO2_12_FULL_67_28]